MAATSRILSQKYPAKQHARKVATYLANHGSGVGYDMIYLEGQKTQMLEDNDQEAPFRQRRNFFYLSGCDLPDSCLTYDIANDDLTLFIPPIDPDDVIWSGLPMSPEEALEKYDVDHVSTTPELNIELKRFCKKVISDNSDKQINSRVFILSDRVSPSIKFDPFGAVDSDHLLESLEESRVTKDEYEVAMIRQANQISQEAHKSVIRAATAARNERELEAAFVGTCMAHGCREQAYNPIIACGPNGATLHYVRNNEPFFDPNSGEKKLNLLIDAGGEYSCYCSDVTRVFPLNGRFTPESRDIYQLVEQMMNASFDMIKAGVAWEDVHQTAHRVAVKGLRQLGILRGDEQELFDKRITVPFFPHGLGHYMGMDTHDVGGHANYEDPDTMFRYLRVRGCLPTNAVITVEPGIYFCHFLLDPIIANPETGKYVNSDTLSRYWTVGGVRLEDDILITANGYENLTPTAKSMDEMERLVNQGFSQKDVSRPSEIVEKAIFNRQE